MLIFQQIWKLTLQGSGIIWNSICMIYSSTNMKKKNLCVTKHKKNVNLWHNWCIHYAESEFKNQYSPLQQSTPFLEFNNIIHLLLYTDPMSELVTQIDLVPKTVEGTDRLYKMHLWCIFSLFLRSDHSLFASKAAKGSLSSVVMHVSG